MEKLLLKQMNISNFKGVKELLIVFSDTLTEICGKNGCGKTTIADAFNWCLFGKNSHGDTSGSDHFREKPLGEDGKEIHNLETAVELMFERNGKPWAVKRSQTETWQRERGTTNSVYKGNAVKLYINGVEHKQKDYVAEIARICNDEVFRYVATLSAFNADDWKKRRAILMMMCAGSADELLLATDKYAPLADELNENGITLNELPKFLAAEQRSKRSEVDAIPVQIQEANRNLPRYSEQQYKDAEYTINETQTDIDNIAEYIAQARNAENAPDARELALQELKRVKAIVNDELEVKKHSAGAAVQSAETSYNTVERLLAMAKDTRTTVETALNIATEKCNKLRKDYTNKRTEPLPEVSTVCAVCGQKLLKKQVEDAAAKIKGIREQELRAIMADGKTASVEIESRKKQLEEANTKVSELEVKLSTEKISVMAAKAQLERINDIEVEADERVKEAQSKYDNAPISPRYEETAVKISGYNERRRELQERQDKAREVLAERARAQAAQKRVNDLREMYKKSGQELAEIEQKIILLGELSKERCGYIEDILNRQFPTVRWKLFDTAINGNINECCVCMIPCDGALVVYECANTASQINADIEIVNVLSDYYQVKLPLFVDNAERVNVLAASDAQMITLRVTHDDELTIERR